MLPTASLQLASIMGPSLLSKTLQGVAVTGLASVGAFFVYTKHCHVTPADQFTPATEPLFQSKWYQKYNAIKNPTTHDEVVRRLPLFKIRPELVEDSQKGGSKLVEAFSQGVWGGPGMLFFFRNTFVRMRSIFFCPHACRKTWLDVQKTIREYGQWSRGLFPK